ncbi:NUDIX domain-containing protein [Hamadaea tsunoensis]|uniref:NUDIX domain-containing protein n=1 Tax=Hamadaea tsunoensis TaxID=53368 RepID=UPI000415E5E3|nr:NUDIX domain-containing protein [Hamadaea tsunoensis]
MPETTWDGLPIADDHPRGAGVVTRRPGPDGPEYLLLHRHHHGPDYEGDWAWTSPSGARLPGEPILTGALRELGEEAGLTGVEIRPVDLSGPWAAFACEITATTPVVLDHEHDRYTWTTRTQALARLAPASVTALFARGADLHLPHIAFDTTTVTLDGKPAGTADYDGTTLHVHVDADDTIATQVIWVYLRDVLLPADPDLHQVRGHDTATYTRAGFVDGILDRTRVFGNL